MKNSNNIVQIPLMVCLLAAASTAFSQTSKDTVKTGKTNDAMVVDPGKVKDGMAVNPVKPADGMVVLTDTGFINKNITDNLMEIQLSKEGLNKGTSDPVKKLALQMIADHTALVKGLQKFASTKQAAGMQSESILLTTPKILVAPGKNFDAVWATKMLAMHEAKILELENFLPVTQSTELKALIGVALPRIRAHRDRLAKIPGVEKTPGANTMVH